MKNFAGLITLIFICSGCTILSEKVDLKPMVILENRNIGNNTKVFLIVKDERRQKIIGYRSAINTGAISITKDPVVILKNQMQQILKSRGFIITDQENSSDAQCVLTLQNIHYSIETSFVDIGIETGVVLDVDIKNKIKQNHYYRIFQSDDDTRMFMAPPADENEDLINQTLSKVFNEIVMDDKLYQSLSNQ